MNQRGQSNDWLGSKSSEDAQAANARRSKPRDPRMGQPAKQRRVIRVVLVVAALVASRWWHADVWLVRPSAASARRSSLPSLRSRCPVVCGHPAPAERAPTWPRPRAHHGSRSRRERRPARRPRHPLPSPSKPAGRERRTGRRCLRRDGTRRRRGGTRDRGNCRRRVRHTEIGVADQWADAATRGELIGCSRDARPIVRTETVRSGVPCFRSLPTR